MVGGGREGAGGASLVAGGRWRQLRWRTVERAPEAGVLLAGMCLDGDARTLHPRVEVGAVSQLRLDKVLTGAFS